ncbi:hypothetical protein [Weissella cibaria]|uniref:hypothetical protein n=1 Tax=Weissella cibaria TaxID=137591 RepID=UPI001C988B19|nr:hypothetical protein [Weissella cibaria]
MADPVTVKVFFSPALFKSVVVVTVWAADVNEIGAVAVAAADTAALPVLPAVVDGAIV